MKIRTSLYAFFILLILVALSGCQNSSTMRLFRPSETPIPPTSTPTLAPTPTETATPTITPIPTATLAPTLARLTVPAGTVTAPILLYHHVTLDADKKDSQYNVDPAKFEEQMKWLHDNGYETITVTDLYNLISKGGEIPQRPVVITFDDGNLDIYNNAYPIMKKYGFVGTFYLVGNYVDTDGMISTEKVKELIKSGWEIGSHSRSHINLTYFAADLADEIRMSKLDMEKKFGVTINSFAYPYGEILDEVLRLTVAYGYTSAVGLGESVTHSMGSIYYLARVEIQNDLTLEQFAAKLPWSGPLQ